MLTLIPSEAASGATVSIASVLFPFAVGGSAMMYATSMGAPGPNTCMYARQDHSTETPSQRGGSERLNAHSGGTARAARPWG